MSLIPPYPGSGYGGLKGYAGSHGAMDYSVDYLELTKSIILFREVLV